MVQYKSSGLAMVTRTWCLRAYLSKHSGTAWNGLRFFYFPSDDILRAGGTGYRPGARARRSRDSGAARKRDSGLAPTPVLRYGAARAAGGLP